MDKNHSNTENSVTGNYNFKSDAVEELVNADSGETPEYSQEELKKYRAKGGIHLPEWLKVVLVKLWFAGALCFFFIWGLSSYIAMTDLLIVTAIVYGMVTDVLVNNVIRFLEVEKGDNDRWMMFPKKGMGSFFLNIVYGFVVVMAVFGIYFLINGSSEDSIVLGVEPILFGTFCMAVDVALVWLRNLVARLFRR